MKKLAFIIACAVLLTGCGKNNENETAELAEATEATTAEITTEFVPPEDRISIFINSEPLQTSIYPEVTKGSVMLPFREIFNALGVTDEEIQWNDEKREISVHHNDKFVMLHIDSETAVAGGEVEELTVAPYIKGGYTMVPVRFVSQALGAAVMWDGQKRIVNIKTFE